MAYPACPPAKGLVYSASKSYQGAKPIQVPCNLCVGCRMARAKDWAVRISHEAQMHEDNCFLTLTFDDEHLPPDYSVDIRDMQLFFKRLRKALGVRLRYFACGEYGDQDLRPHYHAILFGHAFVEERVIWRQSARGYTVYRSPTLERCWPFGFSEVGSLTHESAGYVARYCMKKIGGELAGDHYRRVNPATGELVQVRPEFATMSRKPGLGGAWWDRFRSDAFPSDFVIIDGEKHPVPRFYAKKLEEEAKLRVLADRKATARERAANSTPERLAVREELQLLRLEQLKRNL